MTTQVAVRLDDQLLRDLDWLVIRCSFENRAEAIRSALTELAVRERQREIGEQIAEGYRRVPQTVDELSWAQPPFFPGLPDEDWSDLWDADPS
jgi:Arc/MetJ-type ribon-helix-helix transcriptional regulator